jgi:hypothetical protein
MLRQSNNCYLRSSTSNDQSFFRNHTQNIKLWTKFQWINQGLTHYYLILYCYIQTIFHVLIGVGVNSLHCHSRGCGFKSSSWHFFPKDKYSWINVYIIFFKLQFFMPTPLKVGGHIVFTFSRFPEFRFTTSSLPVYNSVKLNSAALIFGTHVELGWKVCRAKKPLRSALNL